jgi:hypothetical protein
MNRYVIEYRRQTNPQDTYRVVIEAVSHADAAESALRCQQGEGVEEVTVYQAGKRVGIASFSRKGYTYARRQVASPAYEVVQI